MSYTIAHFEDVEEMSDGRVPWRPVRHHLGLSSFGINTFTAREVGDRIINEHDEADVDQEELYIVLQGRARFELDGDTVDATAGTFVSVPPSVTRTAFAEEPNTTLVAIGGHPGKAYRPFGWELWAPLNELYSSGDYAGAIERGRDLVAANPQYPLPFYNLACCESLAGRKEDAIEHLRRAIDIADEFREFARGDSDLDAIRDEPAFEELVAVRE